MMMEQNFLTVFEKGPTLLKQGTEEFSHKSPIAVDVLDGQTRLQSGCPTRSNFSSHPDKLCSTNREEKLNEVQGAPPFDTYVRNHFNIFCKYL